MDNLTFKSRINFVKDNSFQQLKKGNPVGFFPFKESFLKSDEFYTEAVRTCTAGGIIDSLNKKVVGFHFYDGEEVLKNLQIYLDKMFSLLEKPDKALLLGGKHLHDAKYSVEIYQKVKETLKSRLDNVTTFDIHKLPWSESDLHYSAIDDVWDIHTMWRPLTDYRERDLISQEDISNCFESMELSSDDIITFNEVI